MAYYYLWPDSLVGIVIWALIILHACMEPTTNAFNW